MQSLKSERAKKEYEQFVKEVTPKQNLFCNMAKAFIVGGLICVVGQILLHIGKTQFSLSKDDAGSWCSLILILSSVILTGLNIYQKIVTFAGCGALVPITGFANSVAAPAIEYKKEGQVFGIGAKIFTIAGPVILYEYDFNKFFFFIGKLNFSFSHEECFHISTAPLNQLRKFSPQLFFCRIHVFKWKFFLYNLFYNLS